MVAPNTTSKVGVFNQLCPNSSRINLACNFRQETPPKIDGRGPKWSFGSKGLDSPQTHDSSEFPSRKHVIVLVVTRTDPTLYFFQNNLITLDYHQ